MITFIYCGQRSSSAISLDEKEIAVSDFRTGVNLYSLESLLRTRSFVDDMPNMLYYYPLSVKFLADGRFVTMGSHTGQVRIWNRHSGRIVQTLEHNREYLLALRGYLSCAYLHLHHLRISCQMHCCTLRLTRKLRLLILTRNVPFVVRNCLQRQAFGMTTTFNFGFLIRIRVGSFYLLRRD